MKLYRISDAAVLAEMDDGSKYEVPWNVDTAVPVNGSSLETFIRMAGHVVFDSTEKVHE